MEAPDARSVAATVIARVASDNAYASAALDAELERAVQLDGRDRGLATELVYGTLRLLPWLEDRVARRSTRGIDAVEPLVRAHLVIAAYQILVLTRIPAFAAVNEAVTAIRGVRGAKVAGFANAVLRKVAAEKRPSADELVQAALASIDPELRADVVRAIGEDEARSLFVATDGVPPLGLRIENAAERDAWLAQLVEARPHATFELGRVSPLAILARGAGKVIGLPGFAEGAWTAQEEGSQVVALSLGVQPGDIVLDACAGRGNKTGLLAQAAGPTGAADAADLHPKKVERLSRELERIGQKPRATFAVDWSRGTGEVTGPYDRILIDAPCSGTGTIRRRPELGLRRTKTDLPGLAALQRQILERVAGLLKPGGRLVYAVCSILREEAEDVIGDVARLGLAPAPFESPVITAFAGDGATQFRLLPSRHGTDGYFAASFVRTG